jgi:hypothetical protein
MCWNQRARESMQQHLPACAYSYKNPEVVEEKIAYSRQLLIADSRSYVLTTGLNTCMFVVVQTQGPTLAWHAKPCHPKDTISIRSEFQKVGSTYGRFIRGFIIPGVDRDSNLNLKPTCRTMREFGEFIDPTESKKFILGLLSRFEWASQLVTVRPPNHYKDFVVVDPNHDMPFAFSDIALFNKGCVFDAEVDL